MEDSYGRSIFANILRILDYKPQMVIGTNDWKRSTSDSASHIEHDATFGKGTEIKACIEKQVGLVCTPTTPRTIDETIEEDERRRQRGIEKEGMARTT